MANKEADMSLGSFEPGSYILINDIMTGIRKMGEVLPSGDRYRDLVGDEKGHFFPIYNASNPEFIGNTLSWAIEAAEAGNGDVYNTLQEKLLDAKIDRLTAARALYWALTNKNYTYGVALAAGRDLTTQVERSRDLSHGLVAKAETA